MARHIDTNTDGDETDDFGNRDLARLVRQLGIRLSHGGTRAKHGFNEGDGTETHHPSGQLPIPELQPASNLVTATENENSWLGGWVRTMTTGVMSWPAVASSEP